MLAGIISSIVLGGASYSLIESGARSRLASFSFLRTAGVLLLASIVVVIVGGGVRSTGGFPDRVPEAVLISDSEGINKDPRRDACMSDSSDGLKLPLCTYGEGDDIRAIVWGDSHSSSLVNAVARALDGHGRVLYFGYSACPSLYGARIRNTNCAEFNDLVREEINKIDPSVPLIIANRTAAYLDKIDYSDAHIVKSAEGKGGGAIHNSRFEGYRKMHLDTLCDAESKRRVYVVKQVPVMGYDVPRLMSFRAMFGFEVDDFSISRKKYDQDMESTVKILEDVSARCGVQVLDPSPYLCSDEKCLGSSYGRPFYYDDDHLSEYGNLQLVPMFKKVFEAI